MPDTYQLIVYNNSSNETDIAVFQQDPNLGVSNVFTLAWFAKYSFPGTKLTFSWQISYNFVWDETGPLAPGVVFDATQNPAANLSNQNLTKLTYDQQHGAYDFSPPTAGPQHDKLYIQQDNTVPLKQASVGIGMSGFGTFVVQAQPNINLTFTPHPTYYILAGTFKQGQVMDIEQITAAVPVPFNGVTTMYATLNQSNVWTVSSSPPAA